MSLEGPAEPAGDLGGIPLDVDAILPPPTDNEEPGCPTVFGCVAGGPRLVDRLTISLPCTIKLSLDFLRSRVSISRCLRQYLVPLSKATIKIRYYTITAYIQIHDGTDSHVDHAEESLILFFELFLIKDLYGQDALL